MKEKEIGDVLYISSRRLNLGLFQQDINVAWDLAPHDLSIILYINEAKPVEVNCQGQAHFNPTIEDVVNITIKFDDNSFAIIQNSWLDPRKVRETTIVGSEKMIHYDDIEPLEKIRIYDKRVTVPRHYDSFGEFQYAYHYGDIYVPFLKQTEPLFTETTHFIDCIKNKQIPDSDGYAGRKVVRILEAASLSLGNKGKYIKL